VSTADRHVRQTRNATREITDVPWKAPSVRGVSERARCNAHATPEGADEVRRRREGGFFSDLIDAGIRLKQQRQSDVDAANDHACIGRLPVRLSEISIDIPIASRNVVNHHFGPLRTARMGSMSPGWVRSRSDETFVNYNPRRSCDPGGELTNWSMARLTRRPSLPALPCSALGPRS
jgi:hypothetical protein